MSTQTALAPSTPRSARPAAPSPPTPTGTWTHPRIKEIEQRREANIFTFNRKLQSALFTLILLATFVSPISTLLPVPSSLESLSLNSLRILLILATSNSLRPFWAPPDEMSDIPLTPTQRKLLGLPLTPVSSTPILPSQGGGGAYITPPRYARSTPRSDSSRAAVAGSSPVGAGTPYSGSPLARKAMEGRRFSSGSPMPGSPLGNSLFDDLGNSTGNSPTKETLSPSGGRGASVSLNSKWLYQRGKGRPSGGLY